MMSPAAYRAKEMLEIVEGIPKADGLDEDPPKSGDEAKALVPKCEDAMASAEG
jgi:hypothetical protein